MLGVGEGDAEGGGVTPFKKGSLFASFIPEAGGGVVPAGKEAAVATVGDAQNAACVRGPFGDEAGGGGIV